MYLGTCDEENAFDNRSDCDVNRIGGSPVWLAEELKIKCSECNGDVLFVGQMNCPMDEQFHRVLYIFACPQPTCILNGKNWSVIRCQNKIEKIVQQEKKVEVKSVFDNFSFDDLDWQMKEENADVIDYNQVSNKKIDISGDDNNKVVDEMNKLTVSVEEESLEKDSSGTEKDSSGTEKDTSLSNAFSKAKADFKPFYIDVFMEENQNEDLTHEYEILQTYLKKENINLSDIEKAKKSASKGSGEGKPEPYEKRSSSAISQCQKKFLKRVKSCPQQILRYAYNDQGLFYNAPIHPSDIMPCSCGAERIFEFQLMPALREYLVSTTSSNMLLEASESVCVFVFTCSKNCHVEVLQELAIVQRDIETDSSTSNRI